MDGIMINSLSEYIDEIERFPSSKIFFRGEPEENPEGTASALRKYKGEHENFIAFAQHHGIPTSLIDITKSPLVALYFACQNEAEENGYVYLFEENYIDITKIVQKYPKKMYLKNYLLIMKRTF